MELSPALEARVARRDLVLLATLVIGLSRLLNEGPTSWLVGLLLLAAMLLGSLAVLRVAEAGGPNRGVPIESLILPAVAALGSVGAMRLVPLGIAVVPALALIALLIDRVLSLEERLVLSADRLTPEARTSVLTATLVVAFVGFVGVAAVVPGALVTGEPDPSGLPQALSGMNLLALVLGDALVAGLLGYRTAALRLASLRDTLWSALTYAVAIAIGAAALRALGIPRLIGPALLTLAFYLWDAFHGASPSRRRESTWLWQTGVLVVLGILVIAWNLRLAG
jgi:hypothetical protein